jgi:glucosamine--fructose-6-phosphate aminotransferase (isomerizing)
VADVTPFEMDIAEQPAALRRLADASTPAVQQLVRREWDRIVLTGMGSSHFAGIPTWRALTALGRPAWSVDAGQLLDAPGLLTSDTLLVITSQSGASGEAVELLNRRSAGVLRVGAVVGIANDDDSPLAREAEFYLPLHSGPEATVSTKSYLNTLAVHRQLVAAFEGRGLDLVRSDVRRTADSVEALLGQVDVRAVAERAVAHTARRVAFVGWADQAATALFAGLITKESAKVPAEGFIGGQFRHGPFELAGEGMTAVLFGAGDAPVDDRLVRVAGDLLDTGAQVLMVGVDGVRGAGAVQAPGRTPLEALATGAVVAEQLAVAIAQANGVTPGAFRYGAKVTTAL